MVDHRSDIYAVGVILYWMISDRLPFIGRSVGELLVKQLTSLPTALPRLGPSGERIPPALASLTLRCLAREPQRRPTTATLLDELNQLDLSAHQLQRPKRTFLWVSLAVAALLVALAGFGVLYRYGATSAAPTTVVVASRQRPAAGTARRAEPRRLHRPEQPKAARPRQCPVPATGSHPKAPAPARHVAKAKPKAPRPEDDSSGMLDPYANP